jgi:hypothetical protein
VVDDLTTGTFYRFKVSAYNFNGEGEMSDALETYACIAPSKMLSPTRVSSTVSSLTLEWEAPTDDGGCPVLGYAVFRNDGQGGAVDTEINTESDSNIRNLPSLRQATVTNYPADSLGLTFIYQIEVFNAVLSTKSSTTSY